MPDAWNPDRYGSFSDERSRPFVDLLSLVRPAGVREVLDLGCGTGQLTNRLHRELSATVTLGIDRSEAMLERARAVQAAGLRFEAGDVAGYEPEGTFDLVFSNACLHWLDDHPSLWRRVLGWVRPGGQLAIQIPANHDSVPHRVANEVAAREPHRTALEGYTRQSPVLAPEAYAELLNELGCAEAEVFLRVYGHQLASREAVVEWMRGTTLTTYEERLDADAFECFVEDYSRELLGRLSPARPFFYPFKRILMWARKPAAAAPVRT